MLDIKQPDAVRRKEFWRGIIPGAARQQGIFYFKKPLFSPRQMRLYGDRKTGFYKVIRTGTDFL
jgi:hypothetical protein